MNVSYSGSLRDGHPFYIPRLHLKDLNVICYVQKEVVQVLNHPDFLSSLAENEYEYILTGGGKMVGVFADWLLVELLIRTI